MQGGKPERRYKLIKFFILEGDRLEQKIENVKARLLQMLEWTDYTPKSLMEQWFLLFPNQSIYNEGIHLSVKNNGCIKFELIKSLIKTGSDDSICYEYEPSIFYTQPISIFKNIGYQESVRKHKAASIFKCLKFGLEVIIYQQETEPTTIGTEFRKTHLEIVETSKNPISDANAFWRVIQSELGEELISVGPNEISYEQMTIKKPATINSIL